MRVDEVVRQNAPPDINRRRRDATQTRRDIDLGVDDLHRRRDLRAVSFIRQSRNGMGMRVQMVFGAIAGGLFVAGRDGGRRLYAVACEVLRPAFGHDIRGLDTTIYGVLLVVFIIFPLKGHPRTSSTRRRAPSGTAPNGLRRVSAGF